MTLAEQLGYTHNQPNLFQRANRRFARSWFGAWMFAQTLALRRQGHGEVREGPDDPGVGGGVADGLRHLDRRQIGSEAHVRVARGPGGRGLALDRHELRAAQDHPNWYYNLRKHPDAEVRYREKSVAVTAREVAPGPERQTILRAARKIYSGYAAYEARITDRPIHVMVLEPT